MKISFICQYIVHYGLLAPNKASNKTLLSTVAKHNLKIGPLLIVTFLSKKKCFAYLVTHT